MKPYEALTYHGAARRLRPLALRALPHFDLQVTQIRLAYYFTNCIFRLRTPSGWTHLIRICEPGWRTMPSERVTNSLPPGLNITPAKSTPSAPRSCCVRPTESPSKSPAPSGIIPTARLL